MKLAAFKRCLVLLFGCAAAVKADAMATMFLSMAVSVLAYAVPFGWWYALGLVLLLFLHELGHMIASRVVGIGTSAPVFIPFLGAAVSLKRAPVNAKMAANIAIGGPAMGTLSCLWCLACYVWTDSVLLLVLAYTACVFNLFNLIPCEPLDGGKIVAAISPRCWWLGSVIIGLCAVYTQNMIILMIFACSLLKLWNISKIDTHAAYYQVSAGQRLLVLCWYVGLIAVLGAAAVWLARLL